jgi:two-component system, LytTR family, response regulator
MKMRVLIVDDEQLVRKSVRRFLMNHDAEVVAECRDGTSAVDAIRSENPDIVLLDMQMPEMNGMAVIEAVGEARMPATVVLTAYDSYAVRAFEYRVADYVLKPFGRDRFDKAYARALDWAAARRVAAIDTTLLVHSTSPHFGAFEIYSERIAVPMRNGRITFVETSQIQWIEANGNLLKLHTDLQAFELRETLAMMLRRLDPKVFIRIHRSTIVNVRFIKEITPWTNGHHLVTLRKGQTLRASRYQRESMKQLRGAS